jgi:hypothetical protein
VRAKDQRIKWAQSKSALAPFEGQLRFVRPAHRNAAKNQRDAAGRAQRQSCFEGFDRGASIMLDDRNDEPG